ncbi:MAG: hypothetical protein AAGA54_13405 [Myxococcota bacterium]
MADASPPGFDWSQLVEHWVTEHEGWLGLADALIRRMTLAGSDAPELDAVHKGLRRLSKRAQGGGGQYGRWLLRHFGVPPDATRRLQWFAQYHSRFADMPTSVRRDQLLLWDRPPTSESNAIAWVHVGLASIHHRRLERDDADERLRAAQRTAPSGPVLARLETLLLTARLAADDDAYDNAGACLDQAEALLDDEDPEHAPVRARLHGQRAFILTRTRTDAARFADARALFDTLPADSGVPFVDYRRTAGLAYTTWRLGHTEEAAALARRACEHAGDGGYVRFRVMSLNMLARIVGGDEARTLRARAARLADAIEDAHLGEIARIDDR